MNHLKIEDHVFNGRYPYASFAVRHELSDAPLFELSRLAELCNSLPRDMIEYNSGNLAVGQNLDGVPVTELSPADTIRNIENCGSWVVLKHVERDPEFGRLLKECLQQVADIENPRTDKLRSYAGFVFISSAASITPFHIDPELNFLLQIQGEKTLHCFPTFDRELVSEEALELTYADPSTHRNKSFKDEFQHKDTPYKLKSGDGVFIPVHAPHWVEVGDQFSISFSITATSTESRHLARIYKLNGLLRKHLRISPTPVGQNPGLDMLKGAACVCAFQAKKVFRRNETDNG